ncbi:MAG: hypothetical protein JWR23_1244 [Mucilaginibacter sp.]|nr:hypothetical protein [Mucilaginibacter sp.]
MPVIAVSMLAALVIAGLFINGQPHKVQQKIVQADKIQTQSLSVTQTPGSADEKAIIEKSDSNASTSHKHPTSHNKKITRSAKIAKPVTANVEAVPELPVEKSAEITDETDATPLDESLVMTYSAQKKSAQKTGPQPGWEIFEKYINDSAISPDGKTGTVEVSFTVNNNGKLNDFKVTKNLSEAADKKAIEIIKNGPEWVGEANAEPKAVTVKVQFH